MRKYMSIQKYFKPQPLNHFISFQILPLQIVAEEIGTANAAIFYCMVETVLMYHNGDSYPYPTKYQNIVLNKTIAINNLHICMFYSCQVGDKYRMLCCSRCSFGPTMCFSNKCDLSHTTTYLGSHANESKLWKNKTINKIKIINSSTWWFEV